MTKKFEFWICVLALIFMHTMTAKADLMAIWDFGDSSAYYTTAVTSENVNVTPTLTLGGGTLDTDGKNGVAFTDAAGNSHIAGQAAAWDDVKVSGEDAYWIVTIDTTGWENLSFYFDYKAWDSTTTTLDFDYSLDGGVTWINIVNNTAITADSSFHSFLYDLSSITALNNQSSVMLRINDLDENGDGKFAFDNLQITGTVVPEPLTVMFLTIGAAGFIRRK